jgi:hypothetical protein
MIAVAKLNKYESPGRAQMLAELIEVGHDKLWSEVHKLSSSFGNKDELPDPVRSPSLYQFTIRPMKLAIVSVRVST